MTVLKTHSLSKNYGKVRAVQDLSIQIEQGWIYGILGPNGSGKTTTLSMLLDIIPPNSGNYEWFGEAPSHKHRKRIGSLLETPNFYGYLSGERNLKIAAEIKEVSHSDIDRVLKIVNLHDRKKDAFKTYSLGMKQRLAVASALLGEPDVLLLDEPTNGLDPQGISDTRALIKQIAQEGTTIILASHMLDEVEKVCSHVAILKKGVLMVEGKVEEILGDENIIEVKADDLDLLQTMLRALPMEIEIERELDTLILTLPKHVSNKDINQYLFEKGIVLTHLASRKKNLEMQFLEITNQ